MLSSKYLDFKKKKKAIPAQAYIPSKHVQQWDGAMKFTF